MLGHRLEYGEGSRSVAGELRNICKPTAQETLWFQGGNLQQARHFSLYLALQIKAGMEGLPTPAYQTNTESQ